MSFYYRGSGLTWKQYLQADSFFQDVTGEIKRSGEGIKTTISDQTRNIIASNDALAREFGEGFDSVNSTLEWGFGRVVSELSELRAEFSYGMELIAEQLRIQQRISDDILKLLKYPELRLFDRGMERWQEGLLPEALKDLLASAEENETFFPVQLQIGKLYLYGQNSTDNVIDLPKAENHLRLAARYANSKIQNLPDAAKFCGEAYLHAAYACYAQANEKWLAKDADTARHFTEQALELSQNATKVYPQLAEAFYNHAKFAALLGDGKTAVNSLKMAILADRNYCIKADADRDFDGVREYVRELFESLRQQAKQEVTKGFEPVKKLLGDWVYQGSEAKQTETEIQKLLEQAEMLYRNKDTYFDYLDALSLLKRAQQTFDQIPLRSEVTTLTEHSDSVESVTFSPDGRFLVSGSRDTVKIYQTDGFKETATLTGHSCAFFPDGRYLAIGSRDVKIYQTDGFKEIATLMGHSYVFSPDGRYLVSLLGRYPEAEEGKVISRTDGFKEIGTLMRHSMSAASIVFSPDSRYLVSGSKDKNDVKIYQIDGFKEITTLTGHSSSVTSVVFSPDGRFLVSGSEDNTVKIWGKGGISRQEFEEQERRRIEAEKEAERRRKEQELREYRLKNKLCLECGEKLSFWDKLSGAQYCKRHRT